MSRTDAILKRLAGLHPKLIDLSLERIEPLLDRLGRPQDRLPPVIHVAGTNGKGSTIAYLRAFLEAAGLRVHVYTSPHLVRFNERIRLAGKLVSTRRLNATLQQVEALNGGAGITLFEITTAAALKLFAETPADFLLLETGLGGRYDTTNVVARPLGTIITPIDMDHQEFLGQMLGEIAGAKAGILKRGSAAVVGIQRPEARDVLVKAATDMGVSPLWQGPDFSARMEGGRLLFTDRSGTLDLPLPGLPGLHQIDNAALAIAAARHFRLPVAFDAIAAGLRNVVWPARMQPITHGHLRDLLPSSHDVWLDGGHNPHGAAALSRSVAALPERPLVLTMGMMNTRDPALFLQPFRQLAPRSVLTLAIPGEKNAHSAQTIAEAATAAGFPAQPHDSLRSALEQAAGIDNARVLICGSLYLAGHFLAQNGTLPD